MDRGCRGRGKPRADPEIDRIRNLIPPRRLGGGVGRRADGALLDVDGIGSNLHVTNLGQKDASSA